MKMRVNINKLALQTVITTTHNQGKCLKDLQNDFMKMLTKLFHS